MWIVDSNNLEETTRAIEESTASEGPRVIISRHICSLLDQKTHWDKKRIPVEIDTEKCNNCMICVSNFGSPAITLKQGEVRIVDSQFTGCEVCIEVCPYDAIQSRREP